MRPSLDLTCKYCRQLTNVSAASLAHEFLFRCGKCFAMTAMTAAQGKVLLIEEEERRRKLLDL
jgi:hypothetical protein